MQRSTKSLREQWLWTKEHWRDKTAEQFEEKYLQPLAEKIGMALAAVNQLTEILEEAEKELSDHDVG